MNLGIFWKLWVAQPIKTFPAQQKLSLFLKLTKDYVKTQYFLTDFLSASLPLINLIYKDL